MNEFLRAIEAKVKELREVQKLDEDSVEPFKAGMSAGIKFMLDELDRFLVEQAQPTTKVKQ